MELSSITASPWLATETPELVAADQLRRVIAAINERKLLGENTELRMVLSPGTLRTFVQLIDTQTNHVIRRIPPAYLLRIARDLQLIPKHR